MSAATQILFNSPALHSLKRDQLIKLCKIHLLKANGKNKDLIERLQQHAKTLPPDDPLSVATRSDNFDAKIAVDSEDDGSEVSTRASNNVFTLPRPSEQWEVVMDSIPEVDEETLRSNRTLNANSQAGEFGSRGTKASTVASSLKVIATSLGLKRNNPNPGATASSSMSSVSNKEVAFSTLTTSDHARVVAEELPPVEPIPGQMNLQGMPAPSHARLSITQAPTATTIRLVAGGATSQDVLSPPRLKPFATTFDLIPGTPKGGDGAVWPLSPAGAQTQQLYPSLAAFQDLYKPATPQPDANDCSDMDIDIPGGMATLPIVEPTPKKVNDSVGRRNTGATPKSTEKPSAEPIDIFSPAPKPQKASTRSRLGMLRSEPFIFGSPLPQHNPSKREFTSAAQSVLEEMNRRLAEDGVKGIDLDVLRNQQKPFNSEPDGENQVAGREKFSFGVGGMFEKAHQEEFDKMESIVDYAQKRVKVAPEPIISKKRKSSLVVKDRRSGDLAARRRPSGLRVASGASRIRVVPGGFGDEDEEADVGERRVSKRRRIERETAAEGVAQAPENKETTATASAENATEEGREQKEREAIRRRLEHNRAKRRSSMGRPSLVGRAPPPQKPKASRFGFLSTAKSIVQSVWNRGAGSSAPSQIPVSKTVPRKEEAKAPTAAPQAKKVAVVPGSSGPPPLIGGSQSKRVPSGGTASGRPAAQSTTSKATIAPPMLSIEDNATVLFDTSRAPMLSSGSLTATGSRSSTMAGKGSHSRSNSVTCLSSLGVKGGASGNASQTSSMGMRSSNQAPCVKPAGSLVRSRTSSTLMAPTVSSLAKMNSLARLPAASRNENTGSIRAGGSSAKVRDVPPHPAPSSAALGQITNSPHPPSLPCSPPGKIFSQPLSPATIRPQMSLTAAAESLLEPSAGTGSSMSSKPPLPPKPKVLPGRKPRISRSKVIARLASQRAAEAGGAAAPGGGKTRSSVGAGVAGRMRGSHGGRRSGPGDVLMSAKRRVRQSEYVRRRSRAVAGEDALQMDIDPKGVS